MKSFVRPAVNWLCSNKPRLIFALAVALAPSLGIYAFWIEPYWIEVTHHNIRGPLSAPLKIAHLTDIHTSGVGRRERKMLKLIEAERPDIIVITGDSISVPSDYPGLREVLTQLHAPLGVWLVRGNHEDWWGIKNEQEYYESAGVKLLLNANTQIRDGVWLVGFDDLYGGRPDPDKAFAGIPESAYKIALFHSPTFIGSVADRCDLAFAGHTHGGQLRLPLIGPLWLPAFSGEFVSGWFTREGTQLYVNRGIGTSIVDARFLSRPEIAIIFVGE